MSICMDLKEKLQIEKFVLILCVGIATCLRENVLSVDEAELILFTPHSEARLKDEKVSKKIRNLIGLGCELEDVVSLIPESLDESILEIQYRAIEILRGMEEISPKWDKWIE